MNEDFSKIINKKRLTDTFFELLKINSESKNEKEIAVFMEKRLQSLGMDVKNDKCGKKFGSNSGNIIAENKDISDENKRPIFLAAHMDTVKLEGDVIPKIVDGKIINDNRDCILGGDDKVALAAILEAFSLIKENKIPVGKVYIVLTISEEIGILGAKELDIDSIGAKYGFVFDAEGDIGVINNQAPFHNYMRFEITGKSAHAGIEPEKGINAISISADAISRTRTGRIDNATTVNVGKIKGGTATNIVPEKVIVECEARSLSEKRLEEVSGSIEKTFKDAAKQKNASVHLKKIREYDGFNIDIGDYSIRIARKAIKNLGIEPKIIATGGGSDINVFNAKGKSSVNLSSGMERVHSKEEYVKVDQLARLVELILNICTVTV